MKKRWFFVLCLFLVIILFTFLNYQIYFLDKIEERKIIDNSLESNYIEDVGDNSSSETTENRVLLFSKNFMNLFITQNWEGLKLITGETYKKRLEDEIIPLFISLNEEASLNFKIKSENYKIEALTDNEAIIIADLRIEKEINSQIIENQKQIRIYLESKEDKWFVKNTSDNFVELESN